MLVISLSACSSHQSESNQAARDPQPPSSTSQAVEQDHKNPAQAPAATPPLPDKESTPEVKPKVSPQTQPSSSPSTPPSSPAQPVPLPELSDQDKQLVSQVTQEVQKESTISTQNVGLVTVNRVLMAQEAMWLLSGSFSTDFKVLEPNLPMETDEYTFSIPQGDNTQTVVQAIAKSDKLHSFTGGAIAVPAPSSQKCPMSNKIAFNNPPQASNPPRRKFILCERRCLSRTVIKIEAISYVCQRLSEGAD